MTDCTIVLLIYFSGFSTGAIKWDDENIDNKNRQSGSLPEGTYFFDTHIMYCCRSDGSPNTAIELPTAKPFYLFRYTSYGCQRVKNMQVTEEWFHWDDEDDSYRSGKQGTHPKDTGGRYDHRLHYCYYYI